MTARAFKGLAAVSILLAALFVYRSLSGLWFTDVDTFPLISTGRIDSFSALVEIFSSPLMQGLMPNALYYRPLASLSWGIDASIWGLNPFGYHLTDLAIHLANSLLLFFLVRSTAQFSAAEKISHDNRIGQTDLAALLCAFIFAIHPVAMEAVPAIARRADLLYGLFLLLTLHSLARLLATRRGLYKVLVTFFCILAFASKDTALILPGIAIAFVFCFGDAGTVRDRASQCIRTCWPMVVAAVLFLGVRTVVLGGIGGYAAEEAWAHLGFTQVLSESSRPFLCAILLPGNLDTCAYVPRLPLVIAAAAVIVSLALFGRGIGQTGTSSIARRFLFFAALALLAVTLLYVISGTPAFVRTLYVALLFISIAMGWGCIALLRTLSAPAESGSMWIAKALHTAAAVIVVVALGSALRGALSGQYIGEWNTSAEVAELAFNDIASEMEPVPSGSVVYLVNVPFRAGSGDNHPHPMRERPTTMEHSVQGFVDLAFPDKQLDVVALSYARIPGMNPADFASTISFQPEPARVDIRAGPDSAPARLIWWTGYGRKSPGHDADYSRIRNERRMLIDLNQDVARDRAVFFIFTGNRVVKRSAGEAWTVRHLPAGS